MDKNEILQAISVLLYLISLTLIALEIGSYEVPGYEILFTGWMGINISWLGNVALFYAWKNISDYRKVRIASIIAIGFALSIFLYDKLPYGSSGIFKYKVVTGYYFWIASMFVCAFVKFELKEEVEGDIQETVIDILEEEKVNSKQDM